MRKPPAGVRSVFFPVAAAKPKERTRWLAINKPPPSSTPKPAKSARVIHRRDFEEEESPVLTESDMEIKAPKGRRQQAPIIVWQNRGTLGPQSAVELPYGFLFLGAGFPQPGWVSAIGNLFQGCFGVD